MALKPVLPGGFVAVPAIGGTGIIDSNVAWFDSTGNNTTGDGTPGNPYGPTNLLKAFNAGFRSFRVGSGCDLTVGLDLTGPVVELAFYGVGLGASISGTISANQPNQTLILRLSGCITLSNGILCQGANGTSDHLDGYAGNTLTLYMDPTATVGSTINVGGGSPFDDGMGTSAAGGNGGTALAIGGGTISNNIYSLGASGINGGASGSGGSTTCRGAYINGLFYVNDVL